MINVLVYNSNGVPFLGLGQIIALSNSENYVFETVFIDKFTRLELPGYVSTAIAATKITNVNSGDYHISPFDIYDVKKAFNCCKPIVSMPIPILMIEAGRAGIVAPQFKMAYFDASGLFIGVANNILEYYNIAIAQGLAVELIAGKIYGPPALNLYGDYVEMNQDGVTPMEFQGGGYVFAEQRYMY